MCISANIQYMVASLDEPHLETSHPKQKNTNNFRVKDLKALHARTIKTLKTLVVDLRTSWIRSSVLKNMDGSRRNKTCY